MKMIASVSTPCTSGGPQFASRVHRGGGLSQHPVCIRGASVCTPCASGGPQFASRVHSGGLSLHPVCIKGASVCTPCASGGGGGGGGGPQFAPVCIRGTQAMQHGVHVMMSTKVSNACT